MAHSTLDLVAQRYRDEGYDVVVEPREDQIPPFAASSHHLPDLIATRGNEGVIVEVMANRVALSSDEHLARMAEIANAHPGWRLDVVVLGEVTALERAAQGAAEPSNEQLSQILATADELAEKGYAPYAYLVAWGGLEAAMRRVRDGAELHGRTAPAELMVTLYGNGFLSREQFDRLRESFEIRNQVAHGLVPPKADPELVRYVTATARSLAYDGKEAMSPT